MALEKLILVTYLDRNKILKIPSSHSESDLKYLEKEFRREFKFHSNVHLVITFQKFDEDWGTFVELDEDVCLAYKDKLKAVVSPVLSSAATSAVSVSDSLVDPQVEESTCIVTPATSEVSQV